MRRKLFHDLDLSNQSGQPATYWPIITGSLECLSPSQDTFGLAELDAQGIQPETFNPPEGLSVVDQMNANRQWIRDLMDQGVSIDDIGPDPARDALGPFYSMELKEVDGYSNYWRVTVEY